MITKELLGPSDLARAQLLCIHESTEIVVVCKDVNLVFAAFKLVMPSLKGLNNNQELLIIGLVAGLNRDYLSKKRLLDAIDQF